MKVNKHQTVTSCEKHEAFIWGIVAALIKIMEYDNAVLAKDLVKSCSSLEEIEKICSKHGAESEKDLIAYLKK